MTMPDSPSVPPLTWREATLAQVLDFAANRPRAPFVFMGPWPDDCREGPSAVAFDDGSVVVCCSDWKGTEWVIGFVTSPPKFWIGEPTP